MVHRYDLGHALYPGNMKERFHVFLGNTFPNVLPETKFVRYVPMHEVISCYEKYLRQSPYRYTYHQMPNHKKLTKEISTRKLSPSALDAVNEWEFKYADTFNSLPLPARERLFPTIAIWGKSAVGLRESLTTD